MAKDANGSFGTDGQSVTVGPIEGTVKMQSVCDLPDGATRHYTIKILSAEMHFIQRPVSAKAKEGEVAFLDGRDDQGRHKRGVGLFKDGEWRGGKGGGTLPFTPMVWTVCAEMEKQRAGKVTDAG